jgi:uncharacterized membrane protein
MDDATIIMIVFTISGIAEILQGIPLMFEKVKPNWLYGFRLPGTVSKKEVWYPVNRYLGRGMVIAGIILVISTMFLFMVDMGLPLFEKTLVLLFLLIIPLAIVIAGSFYYYKKIS